MQGGINPFPGHLLGIQLHRGERTRCKQIPDLPVHRSLVVPLRLFQRPHDLLDPFRIRSLQALGVHLPQLDPHTQIDIDIRNVGIPHQRPVHQNGRIWIATAGKRLNQRGPQAVDLLRRRPLPDEGLGRRCHPLHTTAVLAGHHRLADHKPLPLAHLQGHIRHPGPRIDLTFQQRDLRVPISLCLELLPDVGQARSYIFLAEGRVFAAKEPPPPSWTRKELRQPLVIAIANNPHVT